MHGFPKKLKKSSDELKIFTICSALFNVCLVWIFLNFVSYPKDGTFGNIGCRFLEIFYNSFIDKSSSFPELKSKYRTLAAFMFLPNLAFTFFSIPALYFFVLKWTSITLENAFRGIIILLVFLAAPTVPGYFLSYRLYSNFSYIGEVIYLILIAAFTSQQILIYTCFFEGKFRKYV